MRRPSARALIGSGRTVCTRAPSRPRPPEHAGTYCRPRVGRGHRGPRSRSSRSGHVVTPKHYALGPVPRRPEPNVVPVVGGMYIYTSHARPPIDMPLQALHTPPARVPLRPERSAYRPLRGHYGHYTQPTQRRRSGLHFCLSCHFYPVSMTGQLDRPKKTRRSLDTGTCPVLGIIRPIWHAACPASLVPSPAFTDTLTAPRARVLINLGRALRPTAERRES